jgi:hypothetical protein
MTKLGQRIVGACLAVIVLCACGGKEGAVSTLGDNSNWLKACSIDSDCGELACLCGLCNQPCDLDSERSCSVSMRATCVEPVGNQCTSGAAEEKGICSLQCSSNADCGEAGPCQSGWCTASRGISESTAKGVAGAGAEGGTTARASDRTSTTDTAGGDTSAAPAENGGAAAEAATVVPGEVTELPVSAVSGLCGSGADLYVVDGDAFAIYRFKWPSLDVLESYDIPTNIGPSVLGDCTVLDGILYYADVGKDSIGSVALASGEVNAREFPTPASRPRSIAADDDALWVSCDDANEFYRVSTVGEVLRSVPNSITENGCEGLYVTATGIWCSDTAALALFEVSSRDGSALAGPFVLPFWEGLTVIDDTFWIGSNGYVPADDGIGLTRPNEGYTVGVARLTLRGLTL